MLSKLMAFLRREEMLASGERVICALSGGADSVALTFAMYLLRDKLGITVEAAHFNHHLRGEESQRDQAFVREFCDRYDIPLHLGEGRVEPGEKGLEAAARDARYGFFATLPGKIATAHTCDDNAETVLMHMVRGTGLKGLGGIAPVRGNIIRPMLTVSREDVLAFLEEYCLSYVTDSSNHSDDFLRNRLRHHVLPLLKQENPAFAANTSAMALRLRRDEQALEELTVGKDLSVSHLRSLPPALRSRALSRYLQECGVKEPEARHLALAESLVFSKNPSAWGYFPGNVYLRRCYDRLEAEQPQGAEFCYDLALPGRTDIPEAGLYVLAQPAIQGENTPSRFTLPKTDKALVRSRQTGDMITTPGGSKSLKKLFIDRKIPAHRRNAIPVVADGSRVLGIWGHGADKRSQEEEPAWVLEFFPL